MELYSSVSHSICQETLTGKRGEGVCAEVGKESPLPNPSASTLKVNWLLPRPLLPAITAPGPASRVSEYITSHSQPRETGKIHNG